MSGNGDDRPCSTRVRRVHPTCRRWRPTCARPRRPRHALAFEVSDVLRELRRAEARAVVTHDARLRHRAPCVRAQADRDRCALAAAEARPAAALARTGCRKRAQPSSRPASPRRQRAAGACRRRRRAGFDRAGRAGRRCVVMPPRLEAIRGDGARMLEISRLFAESASSGCWRRWHIPQSSQPHVTVGWPAFYLAVHGSSPCAVPPTHAILAHSPPEHDR